MIDKDIVITADEGLSETLQAASAMEPATAEAKHGGVPVDETVVSPHAGPDAGLHSDSGLIRIDQPFDDPSSGLAPWEPEVVSDLAPVDDPTADGAIHSIAEPEAEQVSPPPPISESSSAPRVEVPNEPFEAQWGVLPSPSLSLDDRASAPPATMHDEPAQFSGEDSVDDGARAPALYVHEQVIFDRPAQPIPSDELNPAAVETTIETDRTLPRADHGLPDEPAVQQDDIDPALAQSLALPEQGPSPWLPTLPLAKRAARIFGYAVGGYLAFVVALIFVYRIIDPPFSNLMIFHALTGRPVDQRWVPIEDVSRHLLRAVLISEDGRFCDHWGVDFAAIEDAIEKAVDGVPRGASTISMQVTKNLFLWQSKSYIRKLIELPLTLLMELIWPKTRILEVYLNIAEWGPGVFGAEAAAMHHFNRSASKLSEREAAQLAAALPNPKVRDAGDPGPRTARKAGVVQNRMRADGGDVAECIDLSR